MHRGRGQGAPSTTCAVRVGVAAALLCCLHVASCEPAGETLEAQPGQARREAGITISHATTRIAGPLTEEGYVDYAAALNALGREGVTPESNAAVPIWLAVGPGWVPEEIREEHFELLGIPTPPEVGAYLSPCDSEDQDLRRELDVAFQRPWGREELPRLARWIDANEKPLERVLEATRRSGYYQPCVRSGDLPLFERPAPHVPLLRELAYLLVARATLRLEEGRSRAAMEDLHACHRLGRLAARGSAIEHIVGVAIDAVAAKGDALLAHHGGLASGELKAYGARLGELPRVRSLVEAFDKHERLHWLDLIAVLARDPAAESAIGFGPSSERHRFASALVRLVLVWDEVLTSANGWLDRLVLAAKKPTRAERAAAFQSLAAELEGIRAQPWGRPGMSFSRGGLSRAVTDIAASFVLPGLLRAADNVEAWEMQTAMVPVILALARHLEDEGEYPESLADLEARYGEKMPQDIFTSGPLRYARTERGYVLWSPGPNGRDETSPSGENGSTGDDLVFRAPED